LIEGYISSRSQSQSHFQTVFIKNINGKACNQSESTTAPLQRRKRTVICPLSIHPYSNHISMIWRAIRAERARWSQARQSALRWVQKTKVLRALMRYLAVEPEAGELWSLRKGPCNDARETIKQRMLVSSPVVYCSESIVGRAAHSVIRTPGENEECSAKDLGAKERQRVDVGPMMNRNGLVLVVMYQVRVMAWRLGSLKTARR